MASNIYTTGLRNVGAFQVSGVPWITGSTLTGNAPSGPGQENGEDKIQFPYVTKSIMITRTGGVGDDNDLRVHFAAEADPGNVITGKHYLTITSTNSATLNVKCKEIYLSIVSTSTDTATYEVVADLTAIPAGSMFALTGSGITD